LEVWAWTEDAELAVRLRDTGVDHERLFVLAHSRIPDQPMPAQVSFIPEDPEAFARALYGFLHECDHRGARLIVVERLPVGTSWDGVRDRLMRASVPAVGGG
jgi:L-threonylcarbamoyladenylate synthase